MRRFVLWIAIMIAVNGTELSAGPVEGLEYQSESVATSEFVTSGMINPAGLSFYTAMGIRYTHSFTDSTYKGDDALLIGSRRGFFGIEWLNHTSNSFRRKYTLAIGDRIATNFYLGVSYSWFGGDNELYRKMKSFKLGFLYHPHRSLSLGLTADRLNQPKFGQLSQKRIFRPGLAVRPFGPNFTLSSDLRWLEGDDLSETEADLRLAVGPFRGVRFSAEYQTEGSFKIGLIMDFEQMRAGTQGRFDSGRKFAGGSYFIEAGAIRYGSPLISAGRTARITLSGDISDEPESKSILFGRKKTFLQTITALRKGAADARFDELFLKIDGLRLSFAAAQELRAAIAEWRKNGRKVTVYFERGGNLSYYLASVSDKIVMSPTGYLMLNGLSATATFYKGTMDKLGINSQVIRTGPHKTAGDAFTEYDLTDAAREQIDWLLDDLYKQMVVGISRGRRILPEEVKGIIDGGPYTARGALQVNLIDDLKYYDEMVDNARDGHRARYVDLLKFYETEDYNPLWSEPPKIAVVYAGGAIVSGRSGRDILQGKVVGGETLAGALKRVRKDSRIKAIVLRVDSPGGDLFGSDRIYRELELSKGKKPIVVSMGGVAASGGYYISCPGDEIIASPGTITGSIGVIVGKAEFSGFYDKIGLNKTTLTKGRHADITHMDRPATEEEIEHVEKQVWQFYGDFVSKVSTWRKIDYDSVDAIGQGRVWTGRQALNSGLVDSFGGIWDAIETARQKAGIEPDERLIIETYPLPRFSLLPWPALMAEQLSFERILDSSIYSGWQLRLPFDLRIE